MNIRALAAILACSTPIMVVLTATSAQHADRSRVVLISLDGATPSLVERYLKTGALDSRIGLGRLREHGVHVEQNITATPSVTAVSHIALATGSTATHTNIPANSFHPVAATIGTTLSGFGAAIGGYQIAPLAPALTPTAEPLWLQLGRFGRSVVTATWPGGDGADIRIAGTLVQPAVPTRTTAYTVPFGAFGGLSALGFELKAGNFTPASAVLAGQFATAGVQSSAPIQVTTAPVETVFCAPSTGSTCGTTNAFGRTLRYDIAVAALDRTDDGKVNYDTLAFFDANTGVPVGPIVRPSTGPAYVRFGGPSAGFFFEGSGNKVGTAFFVTALAADLSTVRFARYAANFIPRNAAVVADVDDINERAGFWVAQPDFRIPERLSAGFSNFSDRELEAIYQDQVVTFVDYQTRVGLRALSANPEADLAMIYIEQPDGSGHQFTLTDRRQPTDPANPATVGVPGNPPGAMGQDPAKVRRYARYLAFAYQTANKAVERIIRATGIDKHGAPTNDILVVSDHGMAPFHTAVRLDNLLAGAGIDLSLIGIRTTGPAANIYVNLAGREPGGTVAPAAYQSLVDRTAMALRSAVDPNSFHNPSGATLFSQVWTRPAACGRPGFCTDEVIGQDTGDVLALMAEGYNFDGTQSPPVVRLGDVNASIYSVPNFYGAHGYDSTLRSMSAILYAAGPSISKRTLPLVRNIDIAPTILDILGVPPAPTVDGQVIQKMLRKHVH
jgi:predicted AlkP superfamily pyrophosphatase or phosphodiesterase